MDDSELLLAIKRLIIRELDLQETAEADIVDSEPLFGEGLGLDSLDALQLAMALEEQFGVTIPEGDEARPIFASVASIAVYVSHHQKP